MVGRVKAKKVGRQEVGEQSQGYCAWEVPEGESQEARQLPKGAGITRMFKGCVALENVCNSSFSCILPQNLPYRGAGVGCAVLGQIRARTRTFMWGLHDDDDTQTERC